MHPCRSTSVLRFRTPARSSFLLTLALLVTGACLLAPSAHAVVKVHADYAAGTALGGNCHKLGSFDDAGNFYTTTCTNTKLFKYDRNGVKQPDIELPWTAGWFGMRTYNLKEPMDVAPSPDGAYLYVTQGTTPPRRLNRQANGTYLLDATWAMEQINAGGKKWNPIGHMITTDGRGDIYLSNGSYWISDTNPTPAFIVKYAPDGKLITQFGEVGTAVGQWNTNMDVAVSRDGRRVYVGENCGTSCKNGARDYQPSRVTRFDYNAGGQYRYSRVISLTGPYNGKPYPQCEDPGAVHSAYTLAVDAYDNLYAGSVSCGYIQQFSTDPDPAKDKFTKTIVTNINGAGVHNHWLSVDAAGRVYTAEWNMRFAPKNPVPPALPRPAIPALPGPDNLAPVLTAITLPATTNAQDVAIGITANDNVAVAEMRFANEDGTYGPWQPFATPATWKLSNGYAVKGVFVQVRDMAGNESAQVYKTLRYEAPLAPGDAPPPVANGDIAAPVIATATAPAVTGTREIAITTTATDDRGVTGIRFANEDGNWSAWKAFAATSNWTITEGFVNKVIFVQVRDAAGNESANVLVRTRYMQDAPPNPPAGGGGGAPDTVAPTLTKIAIPAETTTQGVNVAITAADAVGVAQVRFANEDGNWTGWQAYANPKAWTLSANFGGKLIFVQVRDAAGNESVTLTTTTQYVRTVAGPLDNADPVLTKVELPATVDTGDVIPKVTATDDVGVTQVRFANEDGNWGDWKDWQGGNAPHQLTAGATNKLVFAQVRDAVGRESNVLYIPTLRTA